MKAEEYRIGNIVMGNKPFALKANDIALAYNHEKLKGEPRWNDVPLTEEWLLRFGFDDRSGNNFDIRIDSFNNLGLGLNGSRWYCGFGSMLKGYSYYNNMFMYIDYVHQLQNLYHALTGRELTITEDETKKTTETSETEND